MADIDGPVVPDEESLAFELLVVETVTGTAVLAVNEAVSAILAAHTAAARIGELSATVARSFARAIALRLRAVTWPPMVPALRLRAAEARDLGQERAIRSLPPELARKVISRPWRADAGAALPTVPEIDISLRTKLTEAARLAGQLDMGKRTAVLAVVGRARLGVAHARGGARWAATDGINAGTAHAARVTELRIVWVAERGACLHCLAHAGYAVEPGDPFPVLGFDPAAPRMPAVRCPPLHPNCRCQVRTYDGPAGVPQGRSAVNPAAALAREARRSVALQWSEHASGAAARRAAGALLRAGADLPVTVQERARRALRTGVPPRRRQP
jgi:hypothetical protein